MLVSQAWQFLRRPFLMTYVEARIAHGQRERLIRHHGGGASTARTQAHRLLRMGPRHKRGPAHAWKVEAVAIAAANGISHTADRSLRRVQPRHKERKRVQLNR
eukprot:4582322-Pleurochrysis_carterae.AAC.1